MSSDQWYVFDTCQISWSTDAHGCRALLLPACTLIPAHVECACLLQVQLCLLDCSVELTAKTPTYALIIGAFLLPCPDVMHIHGAKAPAAPHVRALHCLLPCLRTLTMCMLAGLLNVDEPEFVGDLVRAGHADFHRSLAAGDADRARMLLRLFAALTAVNVVQPGSLLAALQSLASTALAAVETGGHDRAAVCS